MKLNELTAAMTAKSVHGEQDKMICGIEADSRKVSDGGLFVAVKGSTVDGHDFIDDAIEHGATVVVCEHLPNRGAGGVFSRKEKIPLYEEKIALYEEKILACKRKFPSFEKRRAYYEKMLLTYKEKIPSYKEKIESFKEIIASCEKKIALRRGNILPYKGQILTCKGQILTCKEKIASYEATILSYKKIIASFKEKIESFEEKILFHKEKIASCEKKIASCEKGVTFIVVTDAVKALGQLLNAWYGQPSAQLMLVGVTGTNGKTTVATLLYRLFRALGHKAGLISTICNYVDDERLPSTHTTPDAVALYGLLAQMVAKGCRYAFMEVSSHAIDQQRISGLRFKGGIFTNITRDHLDYHLTIENYHMAKKAFFDGLPNTAFALTNMDDKSGEVMLQNTAARKLSYSLHTLADVKGKIVESHLDGSELLINDREVHVHFVGRFNAYNLLAVYGAAVALGVSPEETLVALSSLRPVEGRFEAFASPLGYTAIVDYAHSPDALANVLSSIREVLNGSGRVITVIGAGGDRDRGKRPLMAREASRSSDQVILTSDNPRSEDPEDILRDMTAGLSPFDLQRTLCITDRVQAIEAGARMAKKGDILLVAGKGHETYQEIKGVKYPFDDREIIKELFETQI